ncbi:Site-specific recombinase XerD [Dethiosulfatibacter aminovorans DSM 17477]|uniref:Site-specific recombinase XerD n=1 Tax=Dethiosulfatibacter aminovorans DSM 17477 TaxID=1121476 RepID=A0A1M6IGJ3_9FIRM|nr:tyrosine-type recombinase/integrase [Dethiosulfatibacter aminovorans]SHJ33552.1 Site-specific recombinase XerD [Dethiosulfatibacter aminovorans DSM 17477]
MKANDFSRYLTRFFSTYLPAQKNFSANTISSYKDSFKIFLTYCEEEKGIKPEKISVKILDKELIEGFLEWLELKRHNSASTRNQRLASLHSFFRFIQKDNLENLSEIHRILAIPYKKTTGKLIHYLTGDEMKILLEQPDLYTRAGRRDLVLLVVLYDTAARVQELIDLRRKNVRLASPSVITLHGKGDKVRQVPIMKKSQKLISDYLKESYRNAGIDEGEMPLFYNQQYTKLSRWGVSYIIKKYSIKASKDVEFNVDFPITPHVFRHSKAMHLLQANVNLIYIRDLLGHVDIATTEIYARADIEMKRKALEAAYVDLHTEEMPNWNKDQDLMEWLKSLCD